VDGYIKGLPDTSWWIGQINAGIAYRKKYTHQASWNVWRDYYRGNWKKGILPKNLFFMMVRTIVPRIYFRNPSVSVTAKRPGIENVILAQVLERTDNKMIKTMRAKKQIKKIVQNTFMFGTGFGKLGYGAEFTPTPQEGGTEIPVLRSGTPEYRDGIMANMPWFLSAHPGSIIVPSMTDDFASGRWIAHWIRRPVDDVRDDPRLKNVRHLTGSSMAQPESFGGAPGVMRPTPMIDLVEIRDRKTKKVIVMLPFAREAKVAFFDDDDLQGEYGPSIYPVVFNEDDEICWGVPDSRILEPFQLEMNEIRTQNMKHRRMSIIKIMYEAKMIDEVELEKLLSEDVAAGIKVMDINKVKPMQVAEIPRDLILAGNEVMQDVRESIGFGRNQLSEFKPGSSDTTATEATIIQMASEIRVDERRDMIADMLVNMILDMHRIMFTEWNEEQVTDVVGPAGVSIWVKFTGQQLKSGKYDVNVDPDTAMPETKQLRESRALALYERLKTNPLIDPIRLTTYLLHELHGVQFDDMLRGLPPGTGSQQQPLSVGAFGGLLQKISSRVGERAANTGQQ